MRLGTRTFFWSLAVQLPLQFNWPRLGSLNSQAAKQFSESISSAGKTWYWRGITHQELSGLFIITKLTQWSSLVRDRDCSFYQNVSSVDEWVFLLQNSNIKPLCPIFCLFGDGISSRCNMGQVETRVFFNNKISICEDL